MFLSIFSLFPCAVCCIWALLFYFRRQPNATQRAFFWLSLEGAIFFYLETSMPDAIESTPILRILDSILHFVSLTTPTFMLLAVRTMTGRSKNLKWWWYGAIFPAILCIAEIYYLALNDRSIVETQTFRHIFFNFLLCYDIGIILLISNELYKMNFNWSKFIAFFLAGGRSTSPLVVGTSFILFLIPLSIQVYLRDYLQSHAPLLTAFLYMILGLLLLLVACATYTSHLPYLTLSGIVNPLVLKGEHDLSEVEEILDSLPIAEAEIPTSRISKEQSEILLRKLEKAMNEGRIYLNPTLTIDNLAMHLGTNRLYISNLVNTVYKCSFRDYINGKRIEYSKEYMLQFPLATQETIADACGFLAAQAFNHKFRQIENCTPRQWYMMKQQDKKPNK